MKNVASDMAELVRSAVSAVEGIEEAFRTAAFQLVLAELIARRSPTREEPEPEEKVSRGKSRLARSSVRRSDAATSEATKLKLDVAQLRSLKTYCERFDLGGSEQIAFILANFVREHTGQDSASVADIAYLYRQLVSQRVNVPAVNDIADWSRALGWLTVPSRKKEWLERSGTGYAVSNSGLLRFHELEEQATDARGRGN